MKRLLTVLVILMLASSAIPIMADGDAPFPTKEWAVSTPEEQGISSKDLLALLTPFTQENFRLDSVMIIRNGYVVAEAYTAPFSSKLTHHLMGASGTVLAMGIGVALHEGLIKSLDEPMVSFFPDRTIQNLDDQKKAVTLNHLLTMTSGLRCDDLMVPTPEWTLSAVFASEDMLQATLDLPMEAQPGTKWAACNAAAYVVSAILGKVSGMSTVDYLAKKLFVPLGITDYSWKSAPGGVNLGLSGLFMNTPDMGKLAYLLLQKGQWEDIQLLTPEYVDAMIGPSAQSPWPNAPYGYLIWTSDDKSYASAIGNGGQFFMVFPLRNLAVILTGSLTDPTRVLLQSYPLIAALQALKVVDEALPEDPEGQKALTAYLASLSNPKAEAVPALSELAKAVSGKTYTLLSPNLFYPGFVSRMIYEKYIVNPDLSTKSVKMTFAEGDSATLSLTFADDQVLDVLVGLDNVYRVSPWRSGEIGAKGMWITPDTFRVYLRPLGSGMMHRLDLSFVSFAIDITAYEYHSGEAVGVQGLNME